MITLTTALLLRLIPYGIVAVLATKKGYRWLSAFSVYLIAAALVNVIFATNDEVRALISSGAALLLLMHVLDLKARK